MDEVMTSGMICVDDQWGFTYAVAEIKYVEREDESYCYEIKPNYSVIELLSDDIFQGIPGLDLDLKKEIYVRNNILPVFISERTPGENREDLWELLEACDMNYLNRLEWLIRTDTRYSGDKLYVIRPDFPRIEVSSLDELGCRSAMVCRKVLEVICAGGDIVTKELQVNDKNRKELYDIFMILYKKERKYIDERRKEGIKEAAKNGSYKGRKRLKIDRLELDDTFQMYDDKIINGKAAADKMNISMSTFYRRYREYKERVNKIKK